jgi:hypothetical protein
MHFAATLLLASLLAASATAHGATAAADVRPASEEESASLSAFYRQQYPRVAMANSSFDISRVRRSRKWNVAATVETAAYRGEAGLCKMNRMQFHYDASRPEQLRWQENGEGEQFVWLGNRGACVRPAEPVRLIQRMLDPDAYLLLSQQATLLGRARLLFAGNTSCAPSRAYNFRLAGLDVSAPMLGASPMYTLVFQSDRAATARVWVRRSGQELTAWNVACTADSPQ